MDQQYQTLAQLPSAGKRLFQALVLVACSLATPAWAVDIPAPEEVTRLPAATMKKFEDQVLSKTRQPKARIKGLAGKAPVLKGAYYSVAFYDVGDTNAGAIATVACKAETDVAISGGVQVTGIGDTQEEINAANGRNTPVSSSFPGRMDWSTNSPRPDRLDGWVVQFGGNAGTTPDKAPAKAKVWALCVPGLEVPVEQTYTQSQ